MMKQRTSLFLAVFLLLTLTGCGRAEVPETSTEPVTLEASDLNDILANLNPGGATLTNCSEGKESSYPAGSAIRAERYIETLQGFTWEGYQPPEEWDGSDDYRIEFAGNDVTLTAYQIGYGDAQPLHAVTERGEGWFVLPYIDGKHGEAAQVSWMICESFENWYAEAQTAELYRGSSTPLTADELDWFEDYTHWTENRFDENGYVTTYASPISCFFTSLYNDPRDMDAAEFLYYCPDEGHLTAEDEAEFALVQKKLDWRSGEDNHLFSVNELPLPCHRISCTYLDGILIKYAGITVADMHTDWKEKAFYIPETDCFYTFTSDFGPGMFAPRYGEKDGDTVTLWSRDYGPEAPGRVLTMQKSGEDWRILSHQAAK